MGKKIGVVLTLSFIFLAIFSISLAYASLEISEPKEVYNFGDRLDFTVTTIPNSAVSGFFEINLVCDNASMNIYRIPANEEGFPSGKQNSYSNHIYISKEVIGNMEGGCYVDASLGSERAKTKTFEITKEINLETTFNKESYNPNDELILKIKATRANGFPLEGFAEISGAIVTNKAVEAGESEIRFPIPENMEAGSQRIALFVYDRGKNEEVLNSANKEILLVINQVPTSIDLSVYKSEINPGESLQISTDLFDQSRKKIGGTIVVSFISPKGEKKEYSFPSGNTQFINISTNSTPGRWKILASFGKVSKETEFSVGELEKASFTFLDRESILVVKNIGNVPYNKTIEVKIGENPLKIEDVRLKVGEERKFRLKAPDGNYLVSLTDGSDQTQASLMLTGSAISMQSIGGLNIFKYKISLIFILMILIALILVIIAKYKSRITHHHYTHHTFNPPVQSQRIGVPEVKKEKRSSLLISEEESSKEKRKELSSYIPKTISGGGAESTLLTEGKKLFSPVLVLKIKNFHMMREHGKEEVEKLMDIAKQNKAMIELREGYLIAIFSPMITKAFDGNEMLAVRAGNEMLRELEDYNKKSMDKISFNIGLHAGELLSSTEGGRFRYTSLGNTVILAKKIADSDSGKLQISDSVKAKLMRNVKTSEVKEIGKNKAYTVSSLTDINTNKEKLNDIMKRMKYS